MQCGFAFGADVTGRGVDLCFHVVASPAYALLLSPHTILLSK